MSKVSAEIHIDAPREKVWEILSDLGAVSVWNPVIANSYYTTEAKGGVDAGRHCDFPDGGFVRERVAEWKPGDGMRLDIIEGSVPFDDFYGAYQLRAEGTGTVVTLTLGFEVKPGAPVEPLEAERQNHEELIPAVLAGLKHYAETGQPLAALAAGGAAGN
jgi:uncharacterized protein YndB with AHSA1/START domain